MITMEKLTHETPYCRPSLTCIWFVPGSPLLEDSDEDGDVGGENPDPGAWM